MSTPPERGPRVPEDLLAFGDDPRTLVESIRYWAAKIAEERAGAAHHVLNSDTLRWSRLIGEGLLTLKGLDEDAWAMLKAELVARERLTATMQTVNRRLGALDGERDEGRPWGGV